jgi:hypothetical protein
MKARLLFFGAVMAFGGCAGVGPLPTTSGNPEVTINSENTKRIKETLIDLYSSSGYAVVRETEYTVTVSRALDTGQAMFYQVAMGNAYSSPPQVNISLTITPVGGATKVFGQISIGMRGVFGQDQGTNLNHGKAGRQLQDTLEQLKTRIEAGQKTGGHGGSSAASESSQQPSPPPAAIKDAAESLASPAPAATP